jgi:hypothetical protein
MFLHIYLTRKCFVVFKRNLNLTRASLFLFRVSVSFLFMNSPLLFKSVGCFSNQALLIAAFREHQRKTSHGGHLSRE